MATCLQIEGALKFQPPLPAIGGNEGIACVLALGNDVRDLSIGDRVTPLLPGFGTWRHFAVCQPSDVALIPLRMGAPNPLLKAKRPILRELEVSAHITSPLPTDRVSASLTLSRLWHVCSAAGCAGKEGTV